MVVIRGDQDLMFGDLNHIVIHLESQNYVFTSLP